MTAFRALLITLWLIIAGYTAVVAANHGFGLLALFGGAFFLTAHVLIVSVQANGQMHQVLLGKVRASG